MEELCPEPGNQARYFLVKAFARENRALVVRLPRSQPELGRDSSSRAFLREEGIFPGKMRDAMLCGCFMCSLNEL